MFNRMEMSLQIRNNKKLENLGRWFNRDNGFGFCFVFNVCNWRCCFMKNKFRKFLDKYFRYPYYDFKQGIKNLIKWFPVIWKDRNWDHDFIFGILKFKLKNTAEYIEKRGFHVNAQYDADKMKLCIRLIEKIQSGEYETEYQSYEKSVWDGMSEKEREKATPTEHLRAILNTHTHTYWNYLAKHKSTHKRVMKLEKFQNRKEYKMQSVSLMVGHYNHQRAKDLLFRILSTHIEGWWS